MGDLVVLRVARPIPTLSTILSVRAIAGGGLELTVSVPGSEPVELHPSREELQRFVWAAEDSIAFAEELSR